MILAIMIIITITLPVIAQDDSSFSHTINYKIGGLISIDRQIGHDCSTGAVKKQTVRGYAEMTKHESVRIAKGIMKIDEQSDWSVPANALSGLTVTTTIKLCSRPMSAASQVYAFDTDNILKEGDIINPYHPLVVDGTISVSGLTSQLWATALSTIPGHTGSYYADFVAAYGPGPYEVMYGMEDQYGNIYFPDKDFIWEYDPAVAYFDRDHKTRGYKRGKYYVGNYFNIEQYAYTSNGSLKRFISMSSPFEDTILVEDLEVIGMAAVREAFSMHNLKGGPKAITLTWYELF